MENHMYRVLLAMKHVAALICYCAIMVAILHSDVNADQIVTFGGRTAIIHEVSGGVTGDATFTMTNNNDFKNQALGRYFYEIIVIPGTGDDVPDAWVGAVTCPYRSSLIAIPTGPTTSSQGFSASSVLGYSPPLLGPLTMTFTGIGDGNKVTVLFVLH